MKLPSEIRERDLIPPFHYEGIVYKHVRGSKSHYRMYRILNKNNDVLITSGSEAMAQLIVHALNQTYPVHEKESESCPANEETT